MCKLLGFSGIMEVILKEARKQGLNIEEVQKDFEALTAEHMLNADIQDGSNGIDLDFKIGNKTLHFNYMTNNGDFESCNEVKEYFEIYNSFTFENELCFE